MGVVAPAMWTIFSSLIVPSMSSAPIVRPIPAPPDVAAPPADAVKTKSGLVTKVITPGTGTEHPKADDMVTAHYTGWTTKGAMFDSSYTRGKPSTFTLKNVIPGWSETVATACGRTRLAEGPDAVRAIARWNRSGEWTPDADAATDPDGSSVGAGAPGRSRPGRRAGAAGP